MYYVMNIPEICVLLFILFLWMMSIFCCIKRYEKIRTIERADMPRINKQTESIKNETVSGSNSSLDRRNALTKSNTNLIYDNKSLNKTNSNVNIIGNVLADKPVNSCKQTRMTNSSLINLKQFQLNNKNNNTFSQHSDLESRKLIMSYSPTGLTARSSVEPDIKNSIILYDPKTNTYKQSVYVRNETMRPDKTNKRMAYFSLNFLNYSNGCLNTTDEMKQRLKSTSEPLLFDESNYESNLFLPTAIPERPSHDETADTMSTTTSQFNKRTRSKRGYHKLSCRKRGLHDSNLLNPERIPRLIRKSLLDLHKKSILNLANQRTNLTCDYLAKPSRANKAPRLNATNECNPSRVFTQQRNPNETRMKIRI